MYFDHLTVFFSLFKSILKFYLLYLFLGGFHMWTLYLHHSPSSSPSSNSSCVPPTHSQIHSLLFFNCNYFIYVCISLQIQGAKIICSYVFRIDLLEMSSPFLGAGPRIKEYFANPFLQNYYRTYWIFIDVIII